MHIFHDLLIVDDIYPSSFSPFRTVEYNHYLSFFDTAVLTMEGSQLWIENTKFQDHIRALTVPAESKARIYPFRTHHDIGAKLAYVTFLGNAFKLLPYFAARQLPFILQLYPGGGFAIDQPDVDEKLRQVLLHPLCRKVITTQTITQRYIVEKIGCDPAKIEFIFGGVFDSRIDFDFHQDKKTYPRDKPHIDICFVAHKYGTDVVSKGFDYFVRVARALLPRFPDTRFHVVGDYSATDVDLDEAGGSFTFHGRQGPEFFARFYAGMDAIISFNQPFVLMPGAFDGFPTGACLEAGFRGVANLINDPLKLNAEFVDGRDVLLLDEDFDRSLARITALLEDPQALMALGVGTWRSFHRVMDLDRQLWARSRIIGRELARGQSLVSLGYAPRSAIDGEPLRLLTESMRQRITDLEQLVAISTAGVGADRDRIDALEARGAALAQEVQYWRLTAERLGRSISNRIFEKTKSVVRRFVKRTTSA